MAILLAVGFLIGFFCVFYPVYEERRGVQLILPVTSVSTEEGVFKKQETTPGVDRDLVELTELRLAREKERSRLQERLEMLLVTADEENKRIIHDQLLTLTNRSSMEREVENVLTARGCRGAVVVAHDQSVTVVVKGMTLDAAAVSAIGELVAEVTGYSLEQIRIIE
jgi:hypothetical protein